MFQTINKYENSNDAVFTGFLNYHWQALGMPVFLSLNAQMCFECKLIIYA